VIPFAPGASGPFAPVLDRTGRPVTQG
jgi:hypothetical protein